jgi:hypothetical protein
MAKMRDYAYYQACGWARDDYWLFGIRRKDFEVEQDAERIRGIKNEGISPTGNSAGTNDGTDAQTGDIPNLQTDA